MKRLLYILATCAAALLATSCENEKPEDEIKDPISKGGFRIEVTDLNSSHCKVKVTPEDIRPDG